MNRWLELRRLTADARLLAAVAALAAVSACSESPRPAEPAAAGAALETLVVGGGAAGEERLFDGLIEAVQQATLAAQTTGRVVALERDVDEPVARGQLILRLSAVEQRAGLDAARQALSEAQAMAVEARSTHERTSKLFQERLLSQADLERATAARDGAEARLAGARAGVAAAEQEFRYTEIRAPFAGVVTARHVDVGEAVVPGQPLTAIAAPGALRVNVDVPQSLAERIRQLGRARVHVGERVIDSDRLTVFPAAASGANTVRVRIELPAGAQELYPGMFAKAGFALGAAPAVTVPSSVLVRRSEVTGVYVVSEGGAVSLRQLRIGRRLGDDVEVLAGLSAGERVAADPVAATLVVERANDAS